MPAAADRSSSAPSVVQLAARTPDGDRDVAPSPSTTCPTAGSGSGSACPGPQVVEGWYGRPSDKPLARTREYVEIIRRVVAREEPLDFQGEFFQHPYHGRGQRRPGQAAQVDRPPAAPPHPDLPRRRGPEERGPDRRDRRRLAAAVLLALPPGGLRRSAGRGQGRLRRSSAVAPVNAPATLEDGPGAGRAMLGFYIGGHGGQGPELPHEARRPDGPRRRPRRSRTCSSRAGGTRRSPRSRSSSRTRSPSSDPARIADRVAAWKESAVTEILVARRQRRAGPPGRRGRAGLAADRPEVRRGRPRRDSTIANGGPADGLEAARRGPCRSCRPSRTGTSGRPGSSTSGTPSRWKKPPSVGGVRAEDVRPKDQRATQVLGLQRALDARPPAGLLGR